MKNLNVLTINIGNPSIERARSQVKWIEERHEDIIVLTETKNSEGCKYIEDYFAKPKIDLFSLDTEKKYYVFYPKSITGDLGVMIISKIPIEKGYSIYDNSNIFYSRFAACDIIFNQIKINIIGLYIPSRDNSKEKIDRKKEFCRDIANYIKNSQATYRIICGDFNILDKNHIPHYSTFFDWEYRFYDFLINMKYADAFRHCYPDLNEYSWVGRTNDGYRYDYFFVSDSLTDNIRDCCFLHETRTTHKITDHSAVLVKLDI
jgi:exodeoxyribonuclease-3